ncbi:hypothetical protein HMPREF9629_01210 [Peptoanaerobacter stomatis]|uniref:Transporter, auxin efflux carrier domain protein n=1 Tax=Peptoanaerobacter stomatis TaxID=796937 RepID=G9WYF9_9FIRM|nr:AEC family transporter [Peptoanaerobacter stomatis]EHL16370.1 hypothetical protein HMPREF9629_01210 [Peptoanaerobacter stomatis]
MDINIVINKLIMLLFLTLLGYIGRKKNILNDIYNKGFSVLILNFTLPCMIITSMLSTGAQIGKFQIVQILLLGFCMYGSLTLIAKFVSKAFKADDLEDGVYRFCTVFNNNIFIGFPIIQSMLGDEALFYAAVLSIANTLFMFSVGTYFMSKHKKAEKISIKKILNPGIVTSVICTILYFSGFTLPNMLKDVCEQVGNITVPLSMIVIGVSLADIPVKDVVKDIKIYIFSILRMIIIPVLFFFILSPIITDKTILHVIIITLAMPGATLCVSMATEYDSDIMLASKYVFMSTVLSIATIPLVIKIIA